MEEQYFIVETVPRCGFEVRMYFNNKESAIKELVRLANANLGKKYHVAKIIASPKIEYSITVEEV